MGHLVNPISLRLGRTQLWRSQWYRSNNNDYISILKEDFSLYQYIESFFKYSHLIKKRRNTLAKIKGLMSFKNQKQTSKNKNRNKRLQHLRPSQRKRIRIKRYSTSKMVQKLSLIFSHANIIRTGGNLVINMHIYDGAFEIFKAKNQTHSKSGNIFIPLTNFGLATSDSFYKNKRMKKEIINLTNINLSKKKNITKDIKRSGSSSLAKNFKNSLKKRKLVLGKFYKLISSSKHKTITPLNNFFGKTFNYNAYSSKIPSANLNQIKYKSTLKSRRKCDFKFLKLKSQISTSSFLRTRSNLELRFISSRLHYLFKNVFTFNSSYSVRALKKRQFKRNLKYYFKLVRLLYLLYIKCLYKNRLHNIFLLRLLSFSIFRLRILIIKKLRNIQNVFYKGKNSRHNFKQKKPVNITTVRKNQGTKSFRSVTKKGHNRSRIIKVNSKLNLFKKHYLKLSRLLVYTASITCQYMIENNNLQLYKSRFKIWFYVSRIIFENIRTLVVKNNYFLVKLNYFGLTNATPTAAMLVNYIANKLYQKYTIFETLKPLTRDLTSNFTIEGFKISCAGRLTKKERASLFVQQDKKVPANTIDSFIDYATSIARLRHGVCGLKVWITRKSTYKAFTYNFSYTYSLNYKNKL